MADTKLYTISVTDKVEDPPQPGVPRLQNRAGYFDKTDPKLRSVEKQLTDQQAAQLKADGYVVAPDPPLPAHIAEGEQIRQAREAAEAAAKSQGSEKPKDSTPPAPPAKATGKE